MAPLLEGRRLSDIIFADPSDAEAVARAEEELRRTEITQPAVLTVDIALTRLLAEHGIRPTWSWATRSASTARSSRPARCRSRRRCRRSAPVGARWRAWRSRTRARWRPSWRRWPRSRRWSRRRRLRRHRQRQLHAPGRARWCAPSRSAGRSPRCAARGHQAALLPVSHAFHTAIVAPRQRAVARDAAASRAASPAAADRCQRRRRAVPDRRGRPGADARHPRRVRSPRRCSSSRACARCTTRGRASSSRSAPRARCRASPPTCSATTPCLSLATNHPKPGDIVSFNNALCGLWAAGLGAGAAVHGPRRATPSCRPALPAQPRPAPRERVAGARRRRARRACSMSSSSAGAG